MLIRDSADSVEAESEADALSRVDALRREYVAAQTAHDADSAAFAKADDACMAFLRRLPRNSYDEAAANTASAMQAALSKMSAGLAKSKRALRDCEDRFIDASSRAHAWPFAQIQVPLDAAAPLHDAAGPADPSPPELMAHLAQNPECLAFRISPAADGAARYYRADAARLRAAIDDAVLYECAAGGGAPNYAVRFETKYISLAPFVPALDAPDAFIPVYKVVDILERLAFGNKVPMSRLYELVPANRPRLLALVSRAALRAPAAAGETLCRAARPGTCYNVRRIAPLESAPRAPVSPTAPTAPAPRGAASPGQAGRKLVAIAA